MLVIGKNPVLELLKASPKKINKIILLKTVKPEPRLKEIVSESEKAGIKILFLNHYDFANYFDKKDKSEGISQGVIAFVKDYQYFSLREIVDRSKKIKYPLIVLLDEITDPHNFGAIIRSGVCLGADGIVITRHNSAEVNHTVYKTSSGAVDHIKIAIETNLSNTILYLKNNGYWIVGTDMKSPKTIFETDFKMPVGLVIGSEGKGLRKKTLDNCDILTRIPMSGNLDSLNASVTAAIFMYEIFRQKNQ
jgi:23S rRNA (guanosine2251-2'-O)-methyltransferase